VLKCIVNPILSGGDNGVHKTKESNNKKQKQQEQTKKRAKKGKKISPPQKKKTKKATLYSIPYIVAKVYCKSNFIRWGQRCALFIHYTICVVQITELTSSSSEKQASGPGL
jgi:hypothetical protein